MLKTTRILFFLFLGITISINAASTYLPQDAVESPIDSAFYMISSLKPEQQFPLLAMLVGKYAAMNMPMRVEAIKTNMDKLAVSQTKKTKMLADTVVKLAIMDQPEAAMSIISLAKRDTDRDIILEQLFYEYNRQGLEKEALEVGSQITNNLKRSAVLVGLASDLIGKNQQIEAVKIIEQINTIERDQVVFTLIDSYLKENDFTKARASISSFIEYENQQKALVTIASAYVQNGDFEQATVINETLDKDNQAKLKSAYAIKYAREKKFTKALDLASSFKDLQIQAQTYAAICGVLVANQQSEAAWELAQRIKVASEKNTALLQIAYSEAELGDFEAAMNVVNGLEDISLQEKALPKIAALFASAKNSHYALLLLKQLTDDRLRDLALKQYVIKYALFNDAVKTGKILQEINDDTCRDEAINTIYKYYIVNQKTEAAEQLIVKYSKPEICVLRMLNLGDYLVASQPQKAAMLFEQARQNNPTIANNATKAINYLLLSDGYARLEQWRERWAMINLANQAASNIIAVQARSQTQSAIALKMAAAGERIEAFKLIARIDDPVIRIKTLIVFPTQIAATLDSVDRERQLLFDIMRRDN